MILVRMIQVDLRKPVVIFLVNHQVKNVKGQVRTTQSEDRNFEESSECLSSPADEKQTKTAGERFVSYVGKKLNEFSSRKRELAKKKISDVLFEMEMFEEQSARPSNFQFSNASANYPNTADDSGAYNTGGAYYQNFLNNFPDSF